MTSNTATIPTFTKGDRLAKARQHAGLSVEQMAEVLGVSRNSVGNYEHERVVVRRHIVAAYALATGVPIEWLEHGDDAPGAGHTQAGSGSSWNVAWLDPPVPDAPDDMDDAA